MSVNNGVSAFNIPAIELGICVWAVANRKEGIKLPHNPMTVNNFHCLEVSVFILGRLRGRRKTEAKTILMAPTSPAEKERNPIFISIKELPQMRARTESNNQATAPGDRFI
jgi:hypothetical protein